MTSVLNPQRRRRDGGNPGREGDAADSRRTGPRGTRSFHTNATLFAAPAVSWLASAHLFFWGGTGTQTLREEFRDSPER